MHLPQASFRFARAALAFVALFPSVAVAASRVLEVDFSKLVSRADLHYDQPTVRSEDGLPVGNGRMGSLVWTTPHALRFQINRVDVFGGIL